MADQVLGSVRSRLIDADGQVIWDQVFFNPEPVVERLAVDLLINGQRHTWELTFEPPLEASAEVEVPE